MNSGLHVTDRAFQERVGVDQRQSQEQETGHLLPSRGPLPLHESMVQLGSVRHRAESGN